MNEYNKTAFRLELGRLAVSVILLAYAIVKSAFMNWDIFKPNMETMNIYAGFLLGAIWIVFAIKNIWDYKMHNKITHWIDERNLGIMNKALVYGGVVTWFTVFLTALFYHTFNDASVLLFSIKSISLMLLPGTIVFIFAFVALKK
jgi:hypothetical protein